MEEFAILDQCNEPHPVKLNGICGMSWCPNSQPQVGFFFSFAILLPRDKMFYVGWP